MSDSKVFMFPETTGRNCDPLAMAAMMNGNGGFGGGMNGMWNNPIWAIVFLAALQNGGLFGGGNNRLNGQGLQDVEIQAQLSAIREQLGTNQNTGLLMDAIKGINGSVEKLATNLNCDINAVQTAINSVQSAICNLGSRADMNAMQTINAINSGNMTLANQLAECCCTIRESITRQGYENQLATVNQTNFLQGAINTVAQGQERGFSSVAYETQRQTCDLQNSIKDATAQILEGQRAAEMRELQNKVDALRELNSQKDVVINNNQQTGIFSQMIQAATAPLAGALANLQNDVNGVKCKLPETVTLPFSCATAVPTSAFCNGFGLFGLNNWSNWSNNSLWG